MKPFIISLGTLYEAKNILVTITTDDHITGWGEGSPFPMIVGETQETGLALARDFAKILHVISPKCSCKKMNLTFQGA
jgi:L-alanine-DL-glutamate epimerase-like enolase superfamily enzyme